MSDIVKTSIDQITGTLDKFKSDVQSVKEILNSNNVTTTQFLKDLPTEVGQIPNKIKEADIFDGFANGNLSLYHGVVYPKDKLAIEENENTLMLVSGFNEYTLPPFKYIKNKILSTGFDTSNNPVINIKESSVNEFENNRILNLSCMSYNQMDVDNGANANTLFSRALNCTFNIIPLEENSNLSYSAEDSTLTISENFDGEFGLPWYFAKLSFNGNPVKRIVCNGGVFYAGAAIGLTEIVIGENVDFILPPAYAYGMMNTIAKDWFMNEPLPNPINIKLQDLSRTSITDFGITQSIGRTLFIQIVWFKDIYSDSNDNLYKINVANDTDKYQDYLDNMYYRYFNIKFYNSDNTKVLSPIVSKKFVDVGSAEDFKSPEEIYRLFPANYKNSKCICYKGGLNLYKQYSDTYNYFNADSVEMKGNFIYHKNLYKGFGMATEQNCLLPTKYDNYLALPLNSCFTKTINVNSEDFTIDIIDIDDNYYSAFPLANIDFNKTSSSNIKIKSSGFNGWRILYVKPKYSNMVEFYESGHLISGEVPIEQYPLSYNKHLTKVTVRKKLFYESDFVDDLLNANIPEPSNPMIIEVNKDTKVEPLYVYGKSYSSNDMTFTSFDRSDVEAFKTKLARFDKYIKIIIDSEDDFHPDTLTKTIKLPIYNSDQTKLYNYEKEIFEPIESITEDTYIDASLRVYKVK